MSKPFRSRSNLPPPDEGAIDTGDDSLTRQEFKEECDVNRIMKRFLKHGVLPQRQDVARYGDFSDVGDFMAAQDILLRARGQFESMPAAVRDRFQNDPARFLAFVTDKSNLDEARKLGLLKEEPVTPAPTEVVKS